MRSPSRTVMPVGLGVIGLAMSASAIAIIITSFDVPAATSILVRARPALLALSVLLVAVGLVLRAWRWQYLLKGSGRTIGVRRIVPVLLVGYLGNAALPARLGEPIRAYLLARREALSSFHVLGTTLLERVVDLATLAAMGFSASLILRAPPWLIELSGVAAVGSGALIMILAAIGLGPLVTVAERALRRFTWARAVTPRLDRFASGVGGRSQRRAIAGAALISVAIWTVDGGVCWLVSMSLGSGLSMAAAVAIVAVGALGTSIPSAPGYVGTFELAASAAAGALGLPGADALGLALALHAVTLLPIAAAGAVALAAIGSGGLLSMARAAAGEPVVRDADS